MGLHTPLGMILLPDWKNWECFAHQEFIGLELKAQMWLVFVVEQCGGREGKWPKGVRQAGQLGL